MISREELIRFRQWFEEAKKFELNDPNAMFLATVDNVGLPNIRVVLMKDFDMGGVVFYTNLRSAKGRELQAHDKASLCFNWKSINRTIVIRGNVQLVSDDEADAYFQSRPRQSRIGAWASKQSTPLESKAKLLKRAAQYALKFGTGPVPRPPHWSGFRLIPSEMEFVQPIP